MNYFRSLQERNPFLSSTRSQGLMAHLINHICHHKQVTWLLGADRYRSRSGADCERISSRSEADREWIPSLFWASDWLRELTWLWEGICSQSPPDPLSILSLWLAKTHHMGICSRSAPDPLPKFSKSLTFDSNSTSSDESDVLKTHDIIHVYLGTGFHQNQIWVTPSCALRSNRWRLHLCFGWTLTVGLRLRTSARWLDLSLLRA